jgi:multiple sugar transport system permease protein
VTAPVVMANFISYNTTDWSALAAAGVVMIVPVLVATIIGQRGLLSGLTSGGVRE